jgi:ribosome maturation factor RimP
VPCVGVLTVFFIRTNFFISKNVSIFAHRNKIMMVGDKKSPILLKKLLVTKELIEKLADEHLQNGPLFVTGVKIGTGNNISVYIDGDNGVTIADCVALSRYIENRLDRDKEDFSLDVSSHGAATPLVSPRQYPKHLGRNFEIRLLDGSKAEGELIECSPEEIKLQYDVRENKPLGKGKMTVTRYQTIKYNQIKESKIKLKF